MVSVGESPFTLVGLNQTLQEPAADSAGSVWQVAGLVHAPQYALRHGCDGCAECLPWHPAIATGDGIPMEIKTIIVSVAAIQQERAGWRARSAG